MSCRFITLGDGKAYTTANEIGLFLISKGVKFKQFSSDSLSYHFGTVFNERLLSGLDKIVKSGASLEYTLKDFPKLLQSNAHNDIIIQEFINVKMCETSSVAPIVKGSETKALDLYTLPAFMSIAKSYNVSISDTDVSISRILTVPPVLDTNKRRSVSAHNAKNLLTIGG